MIHLLYNADTTKEEAIVETKLGGYMENVDLELIHLFDYMLDEYFNLFKPNEKEKHVNYKIIFLSKLIDMIKNKELNYNVKILEEVKMPPDIKEIAEKCKKDIETLSPERIKEMKEKFNEDDEEKYKSDIFEPIWELDEQDIKDTLMFINNSIKENNNEI